MDKTAHSVDKPKIKKNDQVIVIAGRDKGKRGRVLEVLPSRGKVKVEAAGIIKRHQKANPQGNRAGGIIDKEGWIDISNVQLIDPGTGKPTRVKYQIDADGTKTGFDLVITRRISEAVGVPVVASGGAGTLEHMADVLLEGKADAVLAASISFVSQKPDGVRDVRQAHGWGRNAQQACGGGFWRALSLLE